MPEHLARSPQLATGGLTGTPVAPLLYLSSADAGWDGLLAQAFHEPRELESWITPPTSDISLILVMGGAMRLAQRPASGPWKEWRISHGDLMLHADAGSSHELRWKSLSVTRTQTLHLRLSKDLLAHATEEVMGADPQRVALVTRSAFQDPLLRHIGFALWRELEQPAPGSKLYAHAAAQMLAVHLLRHYSSVAGPRHATAPVHGLTQRQLTRLTDFVHAYVSHDLSLATLAHQVGFSPYHFARLFRQTTGESPHQFVLRHRIAHAERLLIQPDVPLAEVALACGFANQSHFTQAFKRHLGLTPRAYRQARTSGADF